MKTKISLALKAIVSFSCFLGFLTIWAGLSRSQSEKPEIQPPWNSQKEFVFPSLDLQVPELLMKETRELSSTLLLDHTELQSMVNYLDYKILPGEGVRFRYDEFRTDRMGHEWFLKTPRDLRGKTVRVDYRGDVPREVTFRISKSGSSVAVVKKVPLANSQETKSILIDIPDALPFKEVKQFKFWFDRKSAGQSHGDFMIEKVGVVE